MIKSVFAIGISLIAALTIAAQSQKGLGESVKPYRIVIDSFQIKEVRQVSGKSEILGISKGRDYSINVGETQFFRSSHGRVRKLSLKEGLKLLRSGTKLGIDGLVNPATSEVRAVRANIR